MKRFLILPLLLLFILGCNEEKDVNYNMDMNTEITMVATVGISAEHTVESIFIDPDAEESFQTNNTESTLVNSMKFTTLQIVLDTPEDANFSYIADGEVYVTATNLADLKIGSFSNVGLTRTINVGLNSADAQDHLKTSSVGFKVIFTSDGFAQIDRECTINARVAVDAIETK